MSHKRKALVASCFTACIFLCSLLWNTNRSGVRSVVVQGNILVSTDEVLRTASLRDSLSVNDSLDLFSIEQDLKKHPFVKDAVVSIGSNDKVVITIVERKPVALMKDLSMGQDNSSTMFFVDADTVVIPYKAETRQIDVPIVFIRNRSKDIAVALTVIQALQESASDVLQHIVAIQQGRQNEYQLESDNNCTILIGRVESRESIIQKTPLLRSVVELEHNSLGRSLVDNQMVTDIIRHSGKLLADIRFNKRIILSKNS